MGCQIGALPCTPFASSRRFPQGETRSMERKNRESYISCTIPQFPPLVVNAVSQSPECLSCHMTQTANPVTLLASPLGEESHEVAKGWTRVRMIMILDLNVTAERRHYKTHRPLKGKRLTTFCASLALLQNVFAVHRRAIPQPSGPKAPSNLRTLRPIGPVNPKNLPL